MGFVIHRKVVHSQSCTSLAAMRKPNHSLMPAKFHPQVVATEAETRHDAVSFIISLLMTLPKASGRLSSVHVLLKVQVCDNECNDIHKHGALAVCSLPDVFAGSSTEGGLLSYEHAKHYESPGNYRGFSCGKLIAFEFCFAQSVVLTLPYRACFYWVPIALKCTALCFDAWGHTRPHV
jgi:hypothetical protein